jgi:hypothetical protein
VLRAVRLLADMKATVLASLLQPSYEVFSLFDNVLILSQGEVAFFGTRQEAMDHFTSLGYSCSENTNPAEFLRTFHSLPCTFLQRPSAHAVECMVECRTEEVAESGAGTVANPFKYRADASADEESGGDDFHWLTPAEFVEAYKKSAYYERTMKEVERMTSSSSSSSSSSDDEVSNGHNGGNNVVGEHQEKEYPRSAPRQFLLLAKRAFTKEWRDMTTNRSRVFSAILISLVAGTLFLRLGNHQVRTNSELEKCSLCRVNVGSNMNWLHSLALLVGRRSNEARIGVHDHGLLLLLRAERAAGYYCGQGGLLLPARFQILQAAALPPLQHSCRGMHSTPPP